MYFKCNWITYSNQETHSGLMHKKKGCLQDTHSRSKGTKIEIRGVEKDIS